MLPSRCFSSTSTETWAFLHRAKTASVAQRNDALPPRALEVELARMATAPLMPALAMLAKKEVFSEPSQARYKTRPASIDRANPSRATAIASSSLAGIPKVRTKSVPVPRGMTASSTSLPAPTCRRPFTASLTVPSPPTTTIFVAPIPAARSATFAIPPGPSLKSVSPSSPAAAARWAISGQTLRVEPFAEAGLTRKTVSVKR